MMSLVPQVLSASTADKRGSPALFLLPRCPLPCADTAMRWSVLGNTSRSNLSQQKTWMAGERGRHLLLFRLSPAYPRLKVLWSHRVRAIHWSPWKPRPSLACPNSFWLKENCAAAGNSIKQVSKHFIHMWSSV